MNSSYLHRHGREKLGPKSGGGVERDFLIFQYQKTGDASANIIGIYLCDQIFENNFLNRHKKGIKKNKAQ